MLLKIGLPLVKNLLTSLDTSVLIPLWLKAAKSAAHGGTGKKNSWFRNNNIDNFKRRIASYHEKELKLLVKQLKMNQKTKRWISWYVVRYFKR